MSIMPSSMIIHHNLRTKIILLKFKKNKLNNRSLNQEYHLQKEGNLLLNK